MCSDVRALWIHSISHFNIFHIQNHKHQHIFVQEMVFRGHSYNGCENCIREDTAICNDYYALCK